MQGRMAKFVLLVSMTMVSLVSCATYTIYCSDTSAGYCTTWSVDHGSGACFPGSAKVMTNEGMKKMKDVKRGDMLLGMVDGEERYT